MTDELDHLDEPGRLEEIEDEILIHAQCIGALMTEMRELFKDDGRSDAEFLVAWGTFTGRLMVAMSGSNPDE